MMNDETSSSKPSKTKGDTAVQGTNDNSVVSKCSMAEKGYFPDEFQKHFVSKQSFRSPLINRGYYVRAKAVNHALTALITALDGKKKQVLSLGAGFDSAYFRLESQGCLPDTTYIEIDFPAVISRKAELINKSDKLKEFLHSPVFSTGGGDEEDNIALRSEKYYLVGVDITNTDDLMQALLKCSIDVTVPTILLSEVVITYISPNSSSTIIQWASEAFSDAAFVTYEQILPFDSFGIVMQQHFCKLGSPLKSIGKYPTLASQVERYKSAGWTNTAAVDMNYYYNTLVSVEERERIERMEMFDEYEEWHLKCSHYFLLTATKGCLESALSSLWPFCESADGPRPRVGPPGVGHWIHNTVNEVTRTDEDFQWSLRIDPSCTDWCQVYGHTSTALEHTDLIVTLGGFGQFNYKHGRSKDICVFNSSTSENIIREVCVDSGYPCERMYHTATAIGSQELLILGGRKSPGKPYQQAHILRFSLGKEGEGGEGSGSTGLQACDTEGLHGVRCTCQVYQAQGEAPTPRWRHSATAVQIDDAKKVVVFGGRNLDTLGLDDCYILDIASKVWEKLPLGKDTPEARHSHSAGVWEGHLVVAGGLNRQSQPLNSIHLLNVSTREWSKLPLDNILPSYAHSSVIISDRLYLIGGISLTETQNGITVINLKTCAVKYYSIPEQDRMFPLMLHNNASIQQVSDQTVMMIGGGGNCFSFGTHFNTFPIEILLPV